MNQLIALADALDAAEQLDEGAQAELVAILTRRLAELTPGDLTRTLFTNGGAEGNENAIKMARLFTGRHKIITRYRSYHGATAGASSLSGDNRRWANEHPARPLSGQL